MWHTDRKNLGSVRYFMEWVEREACLICETDQVEGIRVCEKWICLVCEMEMVKTDVRDPKYPFFIHQLKQIWYKGEA